MKRITRAVSVPGQPKASDLWRTPPDLFAALHAEFRFDLDCAADASNHLCDRWLGPGGVAEDALAERWGTFGRRGWLNCPYSAQMIRAFIASAVGQCFGESPLDLLVCLLPHDPSVRWWQHTRAAVEIREIPHRVGYLKADGTTRSGAMFASAVVVFRPQPGIVRGQPRRVVWDYLEAK